MDDTRNYTIVVISDTHCQHDRLYIPTCDFLFHCGDFTHIGRPVEVEDFFKWMSNQDQATHKVVIAGNHDFTLDDGHRQFYQPTKDMIKLYQNVHYLEDESITLDGLSIFGSPASPVFGNWGFGVTEKEMAERCELIPPDTDVVLTHGPAHMVLDYVPYRGGVNTGSNVLHRYLQERNVKMHLCGHIHPGRGSQMNNGVLHVNAACVDDNYQIMNGIMMIEIEQGVITHHGITYA